MNTGVGLMVPPRVRMGAHDAHYAGELVDGARMLALFGDVATELFIRLNGDEGLFRAYEAIEFLAPVRAGDGRTLTRSAPSAPPPRPSPPHPPRRARHGRRGSSFDSSRFRLRPRRRPRTAPARRGRRRSSRGRPRRRPPTPRWSICPRRRGSRADLPRHPTRPRSTHLRPHRLAEASGVRAPCPQGATRTRTPSLLGPAPLRSAAPLSAASGLRRRAGVPGRPLILLILRCPVRMPRPGVPPWHHARPPRGPRPEHAGQARQRVAGRRHEGSKLREQRHRRHHQVGRAVPPRLTKPARHAAVLPHRGCGCPGTSCPSRRSGGASTRSRGSG